MAIRKGTVRERERATAHPALMSRRRAELMEALRARSEPQTAADLAKLFSLHVSTARFHLDALLDAGLVEAEFEKNPARGRPRRLYRSAVPAERVGYQKLAQVLASQWAVPGDDPGERAVEAGRQWALQQLADADSVPSTFDGAATSASAMFADMGFDPETRTEDDDIRILLHACPFEKVARANPDVVCSVHLGLLRGVLDRAAVPDVEGVLTPWDTPDTCVALLTRARNPH